MGPWGSDDRCTVVKYHKSTKGCHCHATHHRTFSDPKVGLVPSPRWRARAYISDRRCNETIIQRDRASFLPPVRVFRSHVLFRWSAKRHTKGVTALRNPGDTCDRIKWNPIFSVSHANATPTPTSSSPLPPPRFPSPVPHHQVFWGRLRVLLSY
jgi:hypothetical protein